MLQNKEEIVKVVLAGTFLILFFATVIVAFVYMYRQKHAKHLIEKEKLQVTFQQELLRTQLEIQEQTFKTISQEIHDNIGQMLSLAKLNLNTLSLINEEKNMEKLKDAKQLVSKSIQDLRDLSKTLNTETIATIGLVKSIEIELSMLQKTGVLQTQFTLMGIPVDLDQQKELILFRIVQEALNNVIKHANASLVQVLATYKKNELELIISDNGIGFDKQETHMTSSGLRNMKSRAALISAKLSIHSVKGEGTQILIELPITH